MSDDPIRYTSVTALTSLLPSDVDRFWSKVDKRGEDECWEWRGSRFSYGYGQFWHGETNRTAHRVSWELANGPLFDDGSYHGPCVCHRCDNPPCVNPAHLFLGSAKENNGDRDRKGRSARNNVKLNPDKVRRIRRSLAYGISQERIAEAMGVCQATISSIHQGKTWRHVA